MEQNTLDYFWSEKNAWYSANKNMSLCFNRFFFAFPTPKDWEEELKRTDINTVCKKELDELRSSSKNLNYRQVMGIMTEQNDWREDF